ncbi:MAG: hypothetical protein ABSH32_29215 [Bryobacteraceae bacterium]|jgi:uncharacterized protein (TIGR03437 family)
MIHSATRYVLIAAATALSALGQSASPSTIMGAGYALPTPINVAPGQVVTVFAAGVGSTLTQPVYAGAGNLPTSLAGIGVTIQQGIEIPAPILEVRPVSTCGAGCGVITAITIQIPYGLVTVCNPSNVACPLIALLTEFFVTENGVAGTSSALTVQIDQVHILTACDTVLGGPGTPVGTLPCQPMVTHANGALVSTMSPAMVGEELVAYAVGLGATNPAVPTGQPAAQPVPTVETFTLDFNFHSGALASKPQLSGTTAPLPSPPIPLFSGLTPGYPGLYQINFIVPTLQSGALPCAYGEPPPPGTASGGAFSSNLTVSVGGAASFDGAAICVALVE